MIETKSQFESERKFFTKILSKKKFTTYNNNYQEMYADEF